MKLFSVLLLFASVKAFAGNPHSFDVPARLLTAEKVKAEVAKFPNYYFSYLIFEESDNAWTEHAFTLFLSKYDGAGPERVCFWVDYDEAEVDPVTRITQNIGSCGEQLKNLVILGTARDDSNTKKAIDSLCPFTEYELIELHRLQIQPYNYDSVSLDDDFLMLAEKMMAADQIVFATPVYWYSMSAQLKFFFDRLTDLLYSQKSIGKALKGKKNLSDRKWCIGYSA